MMQRAIRDKNAHVCLYLLQEDEATKIELQQSVSLTFSLKYLANFTKATPLSTRVTLSMSNDVPLLVEYKLDNLGYVRYYLVSNVIKYLKTAAQAIMIY